MTTLRKLGLDPGAVHAKLVKTLNEISAMGKRPLTIIHGGAKGVDAMASSWAFNTRTPHEVYPITDEEWKALGNAAGPKRNAQMLRDGKPDLVLVMPGGSGTKDMKEQAQIKGVRTFEVTL